MNGNEYEFAVSGLPLDFQERESEKLLPESIFRICYSTSTDICVSPNILFGFQVPSRISQRLLFHFCLTMRCRIQI